MRDSMVFYRSYMEALQALPEEQRHMLFDAIIAYSLDDKIPDFDGVNKALFLLMKPQVDANNKRYENGKKGAESGKNGGRPPKNKDGENPDETPQKPQDNPNGDNNKNPEITPKKAQNEKQNPDETPNENVNVNVDVNANVKHIQKNKNNNINACAYARGIDIVTLGEDMSGITDQVQAESLWEEVRNRLEVEVYALGFDVWIKPLQALGFRNGVLVLATSTETSKNEVMNKYGPLIKAILRRINK